MEVRQPIIIVGVGRCGSTVFHRMLSEHPNVAWLSALTNRYPLRPWMSRGLMQGMDVPGLGGYLKGKIKPSECYDFWEKHVRGFRRPCRDLTAQDVTEGVKRRLPGVLAATMTEKRHRLMVKLTGWPRIGFLHEIFPDARFIHIMRDGRAVVNSMLNVGFWWGWQGPQNWRWGTLTPEQEAEWHRHKRSFVALAGIEWKLLMDATEAARRGIPSDQYMEVRYEALCQDHLATFRQVVAHCGLDYTPAYERRLGQFNLRNRNDKWKQDLTVQQQRILEDVLHESLERYGYRDEEGL